MSDGSFFVLNSMQLVLLRFTVSKFVVNQSVIEFSVEFTFVIMSMFSESVISTLVSLAKITIFLCLETILGKLLMYNRKSKGPSTEPWVTPCLIISHFELLLIALLLLL